MTVKKFRGGVAANAQVESGKKAGPPLACTRVHEGGRQREASRLLEFLMEVTCNTEAGEALAASPCGDRGFTGTGAHGAGRPARFAARDKDAI